MGKLVKLHHSLRGSCRQLVLAEGLQARSEYSDLSLEMRRDVIYCWLRRDDDLWGPEHDRVYVEVTVLEDRCTVAEMDFSSLALMYLQGRMGRPRNEEAARLLAEVYRVTSVPLAEYRDGSFSHPEVLVKGAIGPKDLRLLD